MSAKPVIFISHSTKDLPSQDKCVLVKNELVKVLETKGWKVFLDSHSIEGGDLWRKEILLNLSTAQAGVILMNEAASKSDWVKAEAMIMCFRKSIDPTFPLLPVVFPDADINATFLKTYEPFSFNEIQKFTINCSAEEQEHEIAKRLTENNMLNESLNKVSKDCPWIEGVIDILDQIEMRVLCRAAEKIKMNHQINSKIIKSMNSYEYCLDLRRAIANLMHQKSALDGIKVFSEIVRPLLDNPQKIDEFQKRIFSKWVENESVETLLFVINNYEYGGIVALNTSSQSIARRYINRVLLERGANEPLLTEFSVEHPNGDYDHLSLMQKLESAIKNKFYDPYNDQPIDSNNFDKAINESLEDADLISFCILPLQFADKKFLYDFKKRFPRLILFVLVGENGEELETSILPDKSRILKPILTTEKLKEYRPIKMRWDTIIQNNSRIMGT